METEIRILVVDDDADIALGTRRILEQAGYRAETVPNGAEALQSIRIEPPDMVLLDRNLPDMDGVDVCRHIKGTAALAHIFVIIISGTYVRNEEQVMGLDAGADGYIVRPIRNRELIARLESFVRILRLTRELQEKARTLQASNDELIRAQSASLKLADEAFAEHRRTGEALKAWEGSESKYRRLYESMMDAVATTDMDGHIQESNSVFQELVGYSNDALLNMSANDLTPDQWHAMEARILREQVLQKGHSGVYEKEYRRSDGSIIPVELRTFLLRDDAGQPSGMWAIVRDITERKLAQQAIRSSEERHRLLVEHLHAGVIVHAPDGHIHLANEQASILLGVTIDQLTRMPATDSTWSFVREDETPMLSAEYPFDIVMATLAPVRNLIVGINRPAGDRIWALVNAFPEFYPGDVVRQVIVTFVDVTERKLAQQAVKESEEKFRKAFMTGLDAFYISTLEEGIIVEANKEFESFCGHTRDEILGKTNLELNLYSNAGDRGRVLSILKAEGFIKDLELKYLKKDGTIMDVSLSASIVNLNGQRHVLAVLRDVTERKRLAAQFRQAQKMEALGRLAGGVAHDFNNLLTIIIGCSNFLLDDVPGDNPFHRDVEQIHNAAIRAAELTTNLLAFSRKQLLQPRVLDLNALVRENAKLLARLIGEDIDLVTKLGCDLGRVKADLSQAEQVIMNLAVNARDAMPQGGKLTIETQNSDLDEEFVGLNRGCPAGSFVLLSVSDTGTGMDEDIKSHLFEPFFTTKEEGKGTGIGLSAVYGIVKQNGGYITVDSSPGCGSTFRVYLPRVNEALEKSKTTQIVNSRGTETIFLVEDVEEVRSMARRALESKGYKILEAKDGIQALEVEANYVGIIHLLATDLIMPGGINGRELAERLLVLRPGIRVLYLSGYSGSPAGDLVLEPGSEFLAKPYSGENLARKVYEVLRKE
jgi:two-component system, cell cycle sensor histidine kinase and response regulator CckA